MAAPARWGMRLVLLALVAYAGVRNADGLPYTVPGMNAVSDGVVAGFLTAPAVAGATALSVLARRRGRPSTARWVPLALAVAAAAWGAFVASLYTLADLWSSGNTGWQAGLASNAAVVALLLAGWVVEDLLVRRPRAAASSETLLPPRRVG